MSTYVSEMRSCAPNKNWCWNENAYLMADTLAELHKFATAIGMRDTWFQSDSRWPHYDLTRNKRAQALRLGAKPIMIMDYMRERQHKRHV